MKTIIEGMPRPSAVEVTRDGGGYRSIEIDAHGEVIFHEHRVEAVGHTACGWTHPTWPEEAEGRLKAHRATCEMDGSEIVTGLGFWMEMPRG